MPWQAMSRCSIYGARDTGDTTRKSILGFLIMAGIAPGVVSRCTILRRAAAPPQPTLVAKPLRIHHYHRLRRNARMRGQQYRRGNLQEVNLQPGHQRACGGSHTGGAISRGSNTGGATSGQTTRGTRDHTDIKISEGTISVRYFGYTQLAPKGKRKEPPALQVHPNR